MASKNIPALNHDDWIFEAAENKKFSETIVLVPFFDAPKGALKKHRVWLNSLGYDVVTLNLVGGGLKLYRSLLSADLDFGLKSHWTLHIEKALNEISGRKILFSFSTPSASAIEAIGRRGAIDIAGLVADGGPSGDLQKSLFNLFSSEKPVPSWVGKLTASWALTYLWSPQYKTTIGKDLAALPEGFRILSVRGWKDNIVPPQLIDLAFKNADHLEWTKLALPRGKHLNGLRDHADEYVPGVANFLKSISSAL